MAKITSSVTELPKSCKSVMENMERELEREDRSCEFADIDREANLKIKNLEKELSRETKQDVVLIAYQTGK